MLLAYTPDGTIVTSSGTNSAWPEGPQDAETWLQNVTTTAGAKWLRLHDEDDADLVQAVLGARAVVNNGRVIATAGPPIPPDPTIPVPPSADVLAAQIVALQEWAAQVQAQVDAATEILMGGLQ